MRRTRAAWLALILVAVAALIGIQLLTAAGAGMDRVVPPAEHPRDDRAGITARSSSATASISAVLLRRRPVRQPAVVLLRWVSALLVALSLFAPRRRALASLVPRARLHGPPRAIRRGPPLLHVIG